MDAGEWSRVWHFLLKSRLEAPVKYNVFLPFGFHNYMFRCIIYTQRCTDKPLSCLVIAMCPEKAGEVCYSHRTCMARILEWFNNTSMVQRTISQKELKLPSDSDHITNFMVVIVHLLPKPTLYNS